MLGIFEPVRVFATKKSQDKTNAFAQSHSLSPTHKLAQKFPKLLPYQAHARRLNLSLSLIHKGLW